MALGTALAIAGIGTKLLGGLFGKKTANSAAQLQAQAAQKAGDAIKQSVVDTNPAVIEMAKKAGDDAYSVADKAATGNELATTKANDFLNPYSTAGATAADVLNKGIAVGGDFNRTPTAADIQIDPGYAFRQQQAELALERSAGAHGGVDNGGYLRDLNTQVQGQASQEFAAAYDRFQKSNQARFNNVFSVAGQGQTAATRQGSNLIDSSVYGGNARSQAVQYAGNQNVNATNLTTGRTLDAQQQANEFSTQGANAQAAGKVAGNNALWNGINGAVDAGTEAYSLNMFKPNRWDSMDSVRKLPLQTQRWALPAGTVN